MQAKRQTIKLRAMELKDRLKQARKRAGLTQSELAQRVGIQQASISEIERGLTRSSAHLIKIARVCGVDPAWLAEGDYFSEPRLATAEDISIGGGPSASSLNALISMELWDEQTPLNDDEVYVPLLREVELAAGSGKFAIEEINTGRLRFFKSDLRRNGVQFANAKCVIVSGNSMEPVLRDGAVVGVNVGKNSIGEITDSEIYALAHNGQLRIKQVYRLPAGLRLRSFNRDEYPDEDYTFQQVQEQEIAILGHVFWWGMFSR